MRRMIMLERTVLMSSSACEMVSGEWWWRMVVEDGGGEWWWRMVVEDDGGGGQDDEYVGGTKDYKECRW